jgi:hypothetical protein
MKGDAMEKKTNIYDAYYCLLASSYLEEQREIMLGILEYTPELDGRINIASLERGEWSFNEPEWRLDDGTTFDPIERLLFLPPVEFTIALLKMPFLPLYDCIFLIDRITGNYALSNALDIAYGALINKIILPRDPETNLKLIELPVKSLKGAVKIPDLSWLLSFEEAEAWAVNSFGVSFKEYRDKLENEILEKDTPTGSSELLSDNPTDIVNKSFSVVEKSNQLRLLNQVFETFWGKADRDDKATWPDTKGILFCLRRGGVFSESLAVKGATIIRPDWAGTGNRPKQNE